MRVRWLGWMNAGATPRATVALRSTFPIGAFSQSLFEPIRVEVGR